MRPTTTPRPHAGRDTARFTQELLRAHDLRDGTRRPTREDFQILVDVSTGRRLPTADALGRFGRGGLALLDGDRESAVQALRELGGDERFLRLWGPGVFILLTRPNRPVRPADWEIGLAYGDPLKTAGAELDRQLVVRPDDPALVFGRALVYRLNGEHARVVSAASPVYEKVRGKHAELESFAAQVIADAYTGLGRLEEAFSWFERAVDAGGRYRGSAAFRAGMVARGQGRPERARAFLAVACDEGVSAACRGDRPGPRSGRRPGDRHPPDG